MYFEMTQWQNFLHFATPHANALFNATAFFWLILGWLCVKNKKNRLHRTCMLVALMASTAFLTSYLMYHYSAEPQKFSGAKKWYIFYLVLLIPHIVLAVIMLPLIFWTLRLAIKQKWQRHKKWARWTLPIWLYVSLTGVIIYVMLYCFKPISNISN